MPTPATTSFVALQIRYGLLDRTAEGDLLPHEFLAQESIRDVIFGGTQGRIDAHRPSG